METLPLLMHIYAFTSSWPWVEGDELCSSGTTQVQFNSVSDNAESFVIFTSVKKLQRRPWPSRSYRPGRSTWTMWQHQRRKSPSYSTVRKWADESKHGRERSWRITPVVEGWSLSPHRRLLTRSLTRITQQCIATELGVSQNKVSAHLLLRLLCPDEKQIGHDMSTGNLAVLLSDQMLWTCFLGCKGSAASIRLDKGQS